MDTAVFTDKGLVLAIAAFKGNVKMNFFQGASLSDPHKLFNAGLESKRAGQLTFTKTIRSTNLR